MVSAMIAWIAGCIFILTGEMAGRWCSGWLELRKVIVTLGIDTGLETGERSLDIYRVDHC